MIPRTIKNNKLRCTGVLFELLVRQITSDTLAGKADSPAMHIMKTRFNTTTELGKELQLYHAFYGVKPLTESKAIAYIDVICKQRRRLNDKQLVQEKYELIKDIKAHYPLKEFLSSRDPNYVINASIYKTFMTEGTENLQESILNIRDVANARFTLVEHLAGTFKSKKAAQAHASAIQEFTQQSEDLRLITYNVLIEKFNTKYGNLNVAQKNLLREYINNITAVGTLRTYIHTEVPRIQTALQEAIAKQKSKVTQIKLNEVVSQLNTVCDAKVITDSHMVGLMLALEILKEVE